MTRQCLFITYAKCVHINTACNKFSWDLSQKKKALGKTIVKKVKKVVIFLVESSALP